MERSNNVPPLVRTLRRLAYGYLGIAPLIYLALKIVQVGLEGAPHDWLAYAIARRLDDATFWSVMAIGVAAVHIAAAARIVSRPNSEDASGPKAVPFWTPRFALFWLFTAATSVAMYVTRTADASDPGTFFYQGPPLIRLVQWIEGFSDVASILFGNLFFAVAMRLALVRERPERLNRALARLLSAICFVFAITLMPYLFQGIWHRYFGFQYRYDPFTALAVTLVIWWPLVPLAGVVLFKVAVTFSRNDTKDDRSAPDADENPTI